MECEGEINQARRDHSSSDLAIAHEELLVKYGEDIFERALINTQQAYAQDRQYSGLPENWE